MDWYSLIGEQFESATVTDLMPQLNNGLDYGCLHEVETAAAEYCVLVHTSIPKVTKL
jgi:hypothetical protein